MACIDFEGLAKEKQRNFIFAMILFVIVAIITPIFQVCEFVGICLVVVLALYMFYCCTYCILLALYKVSKKVAEKVQERAEILHLIQPLEDCSYQIDGVLHCYHFLKEKEVQNRVSEMLNQYNVSAEDEKALNRLQKEINNLLFSYKYNAKLVLDSYRWQKFIFRKRFDPVAFFFTEEDMRFLKGEFK